METAIDFTPWGLAAEWPSLRWLELIHGRRGEQLRGLRLGHADAAAMVLTCTFPRARIDAQAQAAGTDPVREIAFEATYAQVNLALHQIRTPGARPDGLVGSLLRYASGQADRYGDWETAQWGDITASVTRLASWQSAFSLGYPDVYLVVHACGTGIGELELAAVDPGSYDLGADPAAAGAMHWELWPAHPRLEYDDLAGVLVSP